MRVLISQLALACGICMAVTASATVRYVDLNCTNATPPFTDWSTAATNIQDAVDVATNGDQILVTNGVYQTGGRNLSTAVLPNRLTVDPGITVQSVNGPDFTVIKGSQAPGVINGKGAVRCVLLNSAILYGFTVTNGATYLLGGGSSLSDGGGILALGNSVVSNCVVIGNASSEAGGGVAGGTVYNSRLQANFSRSGGGASISTLVNCYLNSNTASGAGGRLISWQIG